MEYRYWGDALFVLINTAALASLCVALLNLFTRPWLKSNQRQPAAEQPLVSILIPARNEELNLGGCIASVLAQDYPNIEIVVLDDQSTDGTAAIAASAAGRGVTVLHGSGLPEGWLGKNFACHTLSQNARGNYLLFIDADVRLAPNAVSAAVAELQAKQAGLLSLFPTQEVKSFGEFLVVPLMNWLLLAFLPLRLVYASRGKSLIAANGQFMLFTREAYSHIGGHNAFRGAVVEDMEMARKLKRSGIRVVTLLGGGLVRCRMYRGFTESINGFTKNFYPGFNVAPAVFLLMLLFFLAAFFIPFVMMFFEPRYVITAEAIILSRAFISYASLQAIAINMLLHPVQMLVMAYTGIRSTRAAGGGGSNWKGRRV